MLEKLSGPHISLAPEHLEDEMKPMLFVVLLCASILAALPAPSTQNAFSPDQVQFGPVPPFVPPGAQLAVLEGDPTAPSEDRKSTRLNSSHVSISYAVFCLKKK